MASEIATVSVEFIRAGPLQNQLLSPLTQYLGICGEHPAGVVTLPYEHATFLRKLRDLRYEGGTDEDPELRSGALHDVGVDMARILGGVPGVSGSLSGDGTAGHLIHFRVILSAAELALLPLELAKVPTGAQAPTDSWLALQAHFPVCITRRVRSVPTTRRPWPAVPRILFVAGRTSELPYYDHLRALWEVTMPWRSIREGDFINEETDTEAQAIRKIEEELEKEEEELLTVLPNATLAAVRRAIASDWFTHVHVLAHGADDEVDAVASFGIELVAEGDDRDVTDVVSGERFATALVGEVTAEMPPPAVVTLASCDSANQGGVMTPGGSFAHELHAAGIPFVVGSQFPLSEQGSTALTRRLYGGMLWGESPWPLLTDVRRELHSQYAVDSHDWASLVVYEALPLELNDQLETVRYRQARRAVDTALKWYDGRVDDSKPLTPEEQKHVDDQVNYARARLPLEGAYAMEGYGLRASSLKRQAHAEWRGANGTKAAADRDKAMGVCFRLLNAAFDDYSQATSGFLVNTGEPMQRMASLHWVLVQKISLGWMLGREVEEDAWSTARMSAQLYADHEDRSERAWGHGSLAELWLLKLLDPAGPGSKGDCEEHVARAVDRIIKLYPAKTAFEVQSTCRQFRRYAWWWGIPEFREGLKLAPPTGWTPKEWDSAWEAVVEIASSMVERMSVQEWHTMPGPADA